jgi:hypothetical protein
MDLWSAGAIDPISLYTSLDYPNPYESAKELLMWQLIQKGALPPQALFPDFQAPQTSVPLAPGGPGITAEEGQRAISPDQPDTVSPDSRELLQSVPLA